MTLDAGELAIHAATSPPQRAASSIAVDGPRSFEVSVACYDLAAAVAARARIPVDGAGGWLDREINRWIDLAEAPRLACRPCRANTPHLLTDEHSMLTLTVRTFACARCGSRREQRVLDLGSEAETAADAS